MKGVFISGAIVVGSAILLSACAPQLNPAASNVAVSSQHPPKQCHFLGDLDGHYGDVITGQFVSTRHLTAGSINALKNAAYAKGANYVELVKMEGGTGGAFGYKAVTRVQVTGKAYRCPGK